MITIPTISELYTQIVSDIESEMGVQIPTFGKVWLRAFAAVQAAKLKLFYLSIGILQKNIFADTADRESLGGTLERFGRVKLNRDPNPAIPGQYSLQVTGVIGSLIKGSTTLKSNDNSSNPSKLYVLDEDYTLVDTVDYITVRALTTGNAGKLVENDELSFTIPLAGVEKLAIVDAETTAPVEAENIEDYRTQVLQSYRLEPQGGAASDYRIWTQSASGLKQIYAYAKNNTSAEVNVFVEATQASSTDSKGTPTSDLLNEVIALINFDPDTSKPLNERGRSPLGVFQTHVQAITVKEIDIEISGFIGINAEKQALILSALTEEINKIRPYVAGADVYADKNSILDKNKLISVIINAVPNSYFTNVSFTVDGSGAIIEEFLQGNIPYLNSVTYV